MSERKCYKCGETKPLELMVIANGKRRNLCKPCKAAENKASRERLKEKKELVSTTKLNATQRKSIGAGVYVKREREVNEALPNQFSKMQGVFKSKDLEVRVGLARVS